MNNNDLLFRIPEILFMISAILSLAMVIAQFVRYSHWSVRMFDFPVKQVAIAHLLITVLNILLSQYNPDELSMITIAVGSIPTLILLFKIWPYTPFHKKDVQDSSRKSNTEIKVMSSNVFMDNTNHQKLIDQVKKTEPDCLLLLETDAKWDEATRELDTLYPYQIKYPLENTYGLLFFSKLKIHAPEIRFLLKSDIPSIRTRLEISPNKFCWFYGVHPEPPSPTESDTSEPRDIELLKLAREVRKLEEPIIFAGDFNDVAWSHTTRLFRRFSGLLDPRIGRGSFSTFHVDYRILRWPLDHFFLSSHFSIQEMQVLPSIDSDHFPILLNLNFCPDNTHSTPRPDLDDVSEIKEKLENEKDHTDI